MPHTLLFVEFPFHFHFRSALDSRLILIILCKAGTRARQKIRRRVICCYFSSTPLFHAKVAILKIFLSKIKSNGNPLDKELQSWTKLCLWGMSILVLVHACDSPEQREQRLLLGF